MQMYIWNNIFFSLGFDVRDHYKDLGGDAAAFIAPMNDLQGVRVYSAVDHEGLYTLGTVVVDYRGYRVTAQSIIPGILEREQEQSVVYGSIDFGKTILSNTEYLELLSKAGQQLKILPHSVYDESGKAVKLCSSVECKGIIGNDGRHYILDLLRTFPPDVNFLKLDDEELAAEVKAQGFPIEHKHKLCCLRQELIDSFVETRYMSFIKIAAFHLQQLGATKKTAVKAIDDNKENKEANAEGVSAETKKDEKDDKTESAECTDEAKQMVEKITGGEKKDLEETTKEIVQRAAKAVGSLKDTEFDIRFNPDSFSPGIKHCEEDGPPLVEQRRLVKDAAQFLLTVQIPNFIADCMDHSSAPMDGVTLSESLHNRGINIRYLGKVADLLSKVNTLTYLHKIAVSELLLRAAKHIFTGYMQVIDIKL